MVKEYLVKADSRAKLSPDFLSLPDDLASTANGDGASLVGIEDAAGLFTGTTVEAALAELAGKQDVVTVAESDVGGTSDAITLTIADGPALADGLALSFIPSAENTAAVTIDYNGGGAVALVNASGDALSAGDLATTAPIFVRYDSDDTTWRLFAGGGSAGIEKVADVTELAATAGRDAGDLRYVVSMDRHGTYVWFASDQTTLVSADGNGTKRGVAHPPASDLTGASGAWILQQYILDNSTLYPEWWGAVRDGVTSDTVAVEDAILFLGNITGLGTTQYGFPEIRFQSGIYQFDTTINIPTATYNCAFVGAHGGGSFLQTDQDIVLFMVGDDLSGGGDQSPVLATHRVEFRNLMMRNNDPTSSAVAIQLNYCPYHKIENCTFRDFYVFIDNYVGSGDCRGNHFFWTARTNADPALAVFRFQGVDNGGTLFLPSGIDLTKNDYTGVSGQPLACQNLWLVHCVDGLYINDTHANFYRYGLHVETDGSFEKNRITDIRIAGMYFDSKNSNSGVDIQLDGTVDGSDDNALYRNIHVNNCYFRAGNAGAASGSVATYVIRCQVTGTGNYEDLRTIEIKNCLIENYGASCIFVRGNDSGYLECEGLVVADNTFRDNNRTGTQLYSCVNAEVKSATIRDNTVLPDNQVNVDDGAMTTGDATLTSAEERFTAGLVGKTVRVYGAGPNGETLTTTVDSFTDTNNIELSTNATTTVTGARVEIDEAPATHCFHVNTSLPGGKAFIKDNDCSRSNCTGNPVAFTYHDDMHMEIEGNMEPNIDGTNGSFINRRVTREIAGLNAYEIDSWVLRSDQAVLLSWENCIGGTINTTDDNHVGVDKVTYIASKYGAAGSEQIKRISNGNKYDDSGGGIEVPFVFAIYDGPLYADATAYTAGDIVTTAAGNVYIAANSATTTTATEPSHTSGSSASSGVRFTFLSDTIDSTTVHAIMIGADNETFQYMADLSMRICR